MPSFRKALLILNLGAVFAGANFDISRAQLVSPFHKYTGPVLTKTDLKLRRLAIGKILSEHSEIGHSENWTNPASGNHGELTILDVHTVKAMPCRKIKSTTQSNKIGVTPESVVLDACKVPSGKWKIVS